MEIYDKFYLFDLEKMDVSIVFPGRVVDTRVCILTKRKLVELLVTSRFGKNVKLYNITNGCIDAIIKTGHKKEIYQVVRRRLRAALHSHGLVLNLFLEERCKGPVFSVLSKYLLDILITDKILVFGKEAVNPTNVSYILRGNIPGLILVICPKLQRKKKY
ncbi:uncharacterized protein LOC127875317 [Dreissena polymorpha]|uniref:uncharacterized protein LOC127875317 n=1 Tax=Dreissena polymorpha TaxID=45954 RepID=UPI0022654B81|nr:uncharacterized protein LOC127875317 [Dreissena polymorpha]